MSLRDNPLGDLKVPLTWAAGAAVVLALAGALAIMVTSRGEDYPAGRAVADKAGAGMGGVISAPSRWVRGGIDGFRERMRDNRRLNAQLKAKAEVEVENAQLRDQNERMAAMLGLRTDPPIEMATGFSVTESRGPFAHARLVNVGSEAGVKVGNPVLSDRGLVGRVVGVTEGVSRVLLVTDVSSQTPVMIDRTNARAIMAGDGGRNPRLANLRTRDPPTVGDRVVTSGDGGLMPRGLLVGVVAKGLDGSWRVDLAANRGAVDYVRILKFESFSQITQAQRQALARSPSIAEMAAPPPGGAGASVAVPSLAAPKSAPPARPAAPPPAPKAPAPLPKAASPPGPSVVPPVEGPADEP